MKKIFTLALVAISTICLSSCRKDDGPVDIPVGINSFNFTVLQSEWQYDDADPDGNRFYVQINAPEITEDVFDGGLIKMYRTFNWDFLDAEQWELPYTKQIEILPDGADQYIQYSEHISYRISIGMITIFYSTSDFFFNEQQYSQWYPETMDFRCVVMY